MRASATPGAEGERALPRTTSETRRNQLRQAQKAYHARKKEAVQHLDSRVRFLEQTIEEMSKVMINLNDALLSSATFTGAPQLVQSLQTALRQTLVLASSVQTNDQAAETTTINEPSSISSTNAGKSKEVLQLASPITTSADDRSKSKSDADPTMQDVWPSIRDPSLPELSLTRTIKGEITLQHPVAARVFPFFQDWSEFALRLHWHTLTMAYAIMSDVGLSSLASNAFRFTLECVPREKILKGLRNMLCFTAITPIQADGSIVVTPRPVNHSNSIQRLEGSKSREALIQFLSECAWVQGAISARIAGSSERNQRYLLANEIEPYLVAKGCHIHSNLIIEVPSGRTKDMPNVNVNRRELEAAYIPTRVDGSSLQPPTFNPLDWLDSRVLFPVEEGTKTDSSSTGFSEPMLPERTNIATQDAMTSHFVSVEELIDQLSRVSVCVGTGARYPSKQIDAALDAAVSAMAFDQQSC